MQHCRENGVIPNITVNGWNVEGEIADKITSLCGALAVSRYKPVDSCYNAIDKLTESILDRKMIVRKNKK